MTRRALPRRTAADARGVVLLALLLTLMLISVGFMAAVDVWSTTRAREREEQLMFAGDAYREAIRRYYVNAPQGSPHVLPARLEDLVNDDRFPTPMHHLRRLYEDPITGSVEWGTVQVADRIAGVYSLSERTPLKQAGFDPAHATFAEKMSYRDWVFLARLPSRVLRSLQLNGPTPTDPPTSALREPS